MRPEAARLAVLGLSALEAAVAAALAAGSWPLALGLHGLACAALLPLGAAAPGRAGAMLRLLRLLLPALGPAAVPGALAALLPHRAGAAAPAGTAEAPEADPMEARLEAVAAAARLPEGLVVEALGDVLRWGGPGQRARALAILAGDPRPGPVALLRAALHSPIAALRAEAEELRPAAARLLMQEAAIPRGPARAARLDRAAASGLLPPADAAALRVEAVGLWRALPEDPRALAAMGQGLLALGDLPAARRALEAALARGAGLGEAGVPVLAALLECHVRARDFEALDRLLAEWGPDLPAGEAPPPAWRFWLAEARA